MKKKLLAAVSCCAAAALMLNTLACSPKDPAQSIAELENQLVDEEEAIEEPLFWDVSSPVGDNTNLYRIDSEAFEGKPYVSFHKFGDCILLIGSASYEEDSTSLELPVGSNATPEETTPLASALPDEESGDDSNVYYSEEIPEEATEDNGDVYYDDDNYGDDFEDDISYEYSFDVYSPWRDSITYSLDHTEVNGHGYYAFDSGTLVTYTYAAPYTLTVYNSELEKIGEESFDASDDDVGFTLALYQLADPDTFYSYTYNDNSLVTFHVTEEGTIEETKTPAPLYNMSISGVDQGGQYLVLSGVDPDSMIDVTAEYDPLTGQLTTIAQYQSYGYGSFYGDSYIMGLPSEDNVTEFVKADGSAIYLPDNYYDRTLLPDDSIIIQNSDYDEEADDSITGACLYDAEGSCLSGCQFANSDLQTSADEYLYTDNTYAVFPDQKLVFSLAYGSTLQPFLLAWDYSKPGSYSKELTFGSDLDQVVNDKINADHASEPDYYAQVTKIDDPDSYDWGELSAAHLRAEEIAAKYGVEIYIGPEVPDRIDGYNLEEMTDSETLMASLDNFEKILEMFPENLLPQLCYSDISGLRFYFTGTISSQDDGYLSEASAYVTSQYNHKVMVIDCNYLPSLDYTLSHEFSHMIDSRLDFVSQYEPGDYSEETWAAFNNGDFEYQYNYTDYENYTLPDDYYTYIIEPYASTFPTEDRAMIFGYACEGYLEDDYYMSYSFTPEIDAKLTYYAKCIREGFDTTGWPETMPWEYMLNY